MSLGAKRKGSKDSHSNLTQYRHKLLECRRLPWKPQNKRSNLPPTQERYNLGRVPCPTSCSCGEDPQASGPAEVSCAGEGSPSHRHACHLVHPLSVPLHSTARRLRRSRPSNPTTDRQSSGAGLDTPHPHQDAIAAPFWEVGKYLKPKHRRKHPPRRTRLRGGGLFSEASEVVAAKARDRE